MQNPPTHCAWWSWSNKLIVISLRKRVTLSRSSAAWSIVSLVLSGLQYFSEKCLSCNLVLFLPISCLWNSMLEEGGKKTRATTNWQHLVAAALGCRKTAAVDYWVGDERRPASLRCRNSGAERREIQSAEVKEQQMRFESLLLKNLLHMMEYVRLPCL